MHVHYLSISGRLSDRCGDSSCEIMKWLTSSSAQYDRWLARLAISEISKMPLSIISRGYSPHQTHLLLDAVVYSPVLVQASDLGLFDSELPRSGFSMLPLRTHGLSFQCSWSAAGLMAPKPTV